MQNNNESDFYFCNFSSFKESSKERRLNQCLAGRNEDFQLETWKRSLFITHTTKLRIDLMNSFQEEHLKTWKHIQPIKKKEIIPKSGPFKKKFPFFFLIKMFFFIVFCCCLLAAHSWGEEDSGERRRKGRGLQLRPPRPPTRKEKFLSTQKTIQRGQPAFSLHSLFNRWITPGIVLFLLLLLLNYPSVGKH